MLIEVIYDVGVSTAMLKVLKRQGNGFTRTEPECARMCAGLLMDPNLYDFGPYLAYEASGIGGEGEPTVFTSPLQ